MVESNFKNWNTLVFEENEGGILPTSSFILKKTLKYKSLRIFSQFKQTFLIYCVEDGFFLLHLQRAHLFNRESKGVSGNEAA